MTDKRTNSEKQQKIIQIYKFTNTQIQKDKTQLITSVDHEGCAIHWSARVSGF